MQLTAFLEIIVTIFPVLAGLMLWASNGMLSERHHSHHDTYEIAGPLSWSLVFTMILMGVLGMLMGWLCFMEVFDADPTVVLVFFDAFLAVSFVYWLLLRRYQVVTYDDHMTVTPFIGRTVDIPYADISAMEWTPSMLMTNGRNIHVFVGHRRRALLSSSLDLDQILIRINRFDVIDNLSS